MKERPILFNDEMVRAILAGRKTQTRRVFGAKHVPKLTNYPDAETRFPDMKYGAVAFSHPRWGFCGFGATEKACADQLVEYGACPYGTRGDRLWVRETFAAFDADGKHPGKPQDLKEGPWPIVVYRADLEMRADQKRLWRPSIHMPRWASRISLEIAQVRAELLSQISDEDGVAEGYESAEAFLNGTWAKSVSEQYGDPWLWVIEFKVAR